MLKSLAVSLVMLFCLSIPLVADSDDLNGTGIPGCPTCITISLFSAVDPLFVGLQPAVFQITDGSDSDLVNLLVDLNVPGITNPYNSGIRLGFGHADAAWQDAESQSPALWHEVNVNGFDWLFDPNTSPSETPEPSTLITLATGIAFLAFLFRKRLTVRNCR